MDADLDHPGRHGRRRDGGAGPAAPTSPSPATASSPSRPRSTAGRAARSTPRAGSSRPGFVDVHTHLDAQLAWDPLPTSSCWHGITSVVLGNCGVTFAPVGPGQREFLAEMMESVEDIPRRGHPRGPAVGLDDLRRLPRLARPHAEGHQRRRPRRPLRDAGRGDGRARHGRGLRHARRHRPHVRDGRGGAARRRPRHLHEPDARPRRARRPPGAGHVGRPRRAAGLRRRARPHRAGAVRGRHAPRRARRRGAHQDPAPRWP